jgi:hypothetical protein
MTLPHAYTVAHALSLLLLLALYSPLREVTSPVPYLLVSAAILQQLQARTLFACNSAP